MKHPIPDAALDDPLGFVGMTGSGKTFGAGTCVERILANRGRVIIPDPLGVWWGLRQMADGKTPSIEHAAGSAAQAVANTAGSAAQAIGNTATSAYQAMSNFFSRWF
jgi:hypothetical protein